MFYTVTAIKGHKFVTIKECILRLGDGVNNDIDIIRNMLRM